MLDNDPWCDQPPRQQQQRQSSSSYHHPLIRRQRNEVGGGGGGSEENYSFHRAANASHCVNNVEDAMPSMTPSSPPSSTSSSSMVTTTTEIPHSISSSSTTSASRATTAAAARVSPPSWSAASSGSAATNAEPFARNVSDPTMTTVRRRPNDAMMIATSTAMEAAAVIGDAVVADDDDDEAARRGAQHTPQQHQQAARRQRRRRETAEEALRGVASHLGSYQNPAASLAMRGGAAATATVPPQQPPRPGSAAARAEVMRSSASSSFGAAAALCDDSADRQQQGGLVQCFSQPIDDADPKTRITGGPNNKSVLVLPGLDIHAPPPQQHRRTSGSNAYDDASIAGQEHPPQGFNLVPPTRPPSMITKRRSSTLSTSSSLKSFGDEESVSSSTSSSIVMASSGAEQRRRSTLSSTLPSMMLDGVESSPSLCANASFSSAQSAPVARMRMAGEAAAVRSSPVGRNSGSGRIAGVKRRYSSSSSSFPGCDTASHIREGAANVFIPPMAASIVPMSSMKFRRVSDRRVSSLSVSSSSSLASAPALLRIDSGAGTTASAPCSASAQASPTAAAVAVTTNQVNANASTSTDVTQKEQQSHFIHKSAHARALAACQSYTPSSIDHAPSDLLQSISKSFGSLVDARVCSWTTRLNALSSKTNTTEGSDEVQQVNLRNRLMATSSSGSECYKVTAVVTQFEILPSPASSNNTASAPTASAPTSSSNGAAAEAHDDDHNENDDDKDVEVVLPIIFESYMDVSFPRHHPPEGENESEEEEELAMTVPLRAPGVITGTMTQQSEPRLTHVQVQLDTEALLTSMSAQARLVVFKAVMGATTGKATASTSPTGRGSDGRSRPPLFRQASCPQPPIRPVVQRDNSLRSCPGRTAVAAADGHLLKRTLSSIRLSALKRGNRAHSELFAVHHSAGSIGQGGTSHKTGTRKHGLVYSWEQATTSSASTSRSNDGSSSSSMGGGPLSKRPKLKKDALSSFGRSHRNSSRMSKRNASFAEFGQVHHIHPQHAGVPRLVDGSLRVVPSG